MSASRTLWWPAISLLIACSVSINGVIAAGESNRLGIVVQKVPQPYNQILRDIITGIEISYGGILEVYDGSTPITEWVKEKSLDTVVALGANSLHVCQELTTLENVKLIAGAISTPPTDLHRQISGVIMVPAPQKVFTVLKSIAPGVKRLHIVYWPPAGDWLLPYIARASIESDIPVLLYPVQSSQESLATYSDIIDDHLNVDDALWLQNDPVSLNTAIVSELLRKAWKRKFVLVSSRIEHVARGVLVGLYPNQIRMGSQIGALAMSVQSDVSQIPVLQPVDDVNVAVHIHSANHLELSLSHVTQRFDIIFPTRQ